MKKHITLLAILCLLSITAQAQTLVATWNAKHLGQSESRNWAQTAQVIQGFDFVAIQEAHTEQSIQTLVTALERATGDDYESLVSHKAVGTKRYKELYAFIWKQRKIRYQGLANLYLDPGNRFIREPFAAAFKTNDGISFMAANLHAIYGKKKAQRRAEAMLLDDYVDYLREDVLHGKRMPILIMGDFNLPPKDAAFSELRAKGFIPVVTQGASTLSKTNGKYANLYDNIWVNPPAEHFVTHAGIYPFPKVLNVSHQIARKTISDHAPVYLRMSGE